MAMTRHDKMARSYYAYRLREQGCKTYADLLELFEFWDFDPAEYAYSNPKLARELMWRVAWMEPGKGRICVNSTLEEHQKLLSIRHEILHEYLDHEIRAIEHLAKKFPEIAQAEKEEDIPEITLRDVLYRTRTADGSASIFNIAGDYEISNLGYTEQDKDDLRHIKLNGQVVSGLVTEDQHPEWVNLSLEEMYDLLIDEMEKRRDQAKGDGQGQGGSSNDDADDSNGGQNQGTSGNGGKSEPVTIIKGTYKHGSFYDADGNLITPEE